MSTVDKALSVLNLFSESTPNLGLSEIARQLGWDKSNIQRYVSDLARHGILEQSPKDKTYYLGPSLTRLSMLRDLTHPVAGEVARALHDLAEVTGETAHSSMLVGDRLMTTGVVETKIKGTRVYIDPAEALPFHATASGLAFLSASPDARVDKVLGGNLPRFTSNTELDRNRLLGHIEKVQEAGYAKASGTYESDVVGVAAAIIGFRGEAVGAIAVATPASRFSEDTEGATSGHVMKVASQVSRIHGAE